MPNASIAERIWYQEGVTPAIVRTILTPLSWGFGAAVRARNALYDAGVLRSDKAPIPVLSVGNLTVGGTGKTPVSAYLATRLRELGARPALVMRGVGNDELYSYERLAPGVPVIADPDRPRGVRDAASKGADVAILDDAFQHRRIRRDVDVVLVSADRDASARLLPAGPARESLGALRRADLVVVTRKAATREAAKTLREFLRGISRRATIAQVALLPRELRHWHSEEVRPLDALAGRRVLAVAGIGDPTAFLRQIAPLTRKLEPFVYDDHHAYTETEVAAIAGSADAFDLVVSTLKDAVKLGPQWPRQAPKLWYVSQRLDVEEGESELERILARLLDLRHSYRQ